MERSRICARQKRCRRPESALSWPESSICSVPLGSGYAASVIDAGIPEAGTNGGVLVATRR